MSYEIDKINEMIQSKSLFVEKIKTELKKVIVGQDYMIERLLIGLLADGHILVEGVPGLAKTLTINSLAETINAQFNRIQFTPDLLPADLIGTLIYNQKEMNFQVSKGPVFANIILADEINRSPAKVQSALLEAMQEKQVTISKETFKLPSPFLVLATQNPIEQEGTYALPEAQVDRFMLKLNITYPEPNEELEILKKMTKFEKPKVDAIIKLSEIEEAKKIIYNIYIDGKLEEYIVRIINATRYPEKIGLKDIKQLIEYGASPRATINFGICSRAVAFMNHRGYVTPDDIKSIAPDILRHRLALTYEAEAEEINTDDIIKTILDSVEVP